MENYLGTLLISIGEQDIYSDICIQAAKLATNLHKHWIAQRYSWLYNIENGRSLILAQRLLAKDCFPNQVITNKYIYTYTANYNREKYIRYKTKQKLLNRKQINLVLDKNIAGTLQSYTKGEKNIV